MGNMSNGEAAEQLGRNRAEEMVDIVKNADFSNCATPDMKQVYMYLVESMAILINGGGVASKNKTWGEVLKESFLIFAKYHPAALVLLFAIFVLAKMNGVDLIP